MSKPSSRGRRRAKSTPVRPTRHFSLTAGALIAAAGLIAYSNSCTGAFVFDDEPAIVENEHIRQLTPVSRAMGAPAGTTVSGRPIAAYTLAINYALAPPDARDVLREPLSRAPWADVSRYRSNVWGYHAFNVLVHIAAALTLFGVVRRTLLSERLRAQFESQATNLALAVALLWVVHPLTTASVTYVIQRVESLMSLFYLLTLYCAIRAWHPRARRGVWIAASAVSCVLGMATKESMVSAPLAVVLWDFLFAGRMRWRFYAALAAGWIVLAVLVSGDHRPHAAGFGFAEWPWWRYLATQAGVILHYLRLVFVPWPLVLDYDWRPVSTIAALVPVTTMATLVGVTIWAVYRRNPIAFSAAVFFLVLAPSSSVLPIVSEVAAEHRMYLPFASVLALVVIAASTALNRVAIPRFARPVIVVTAAAVLCARTLDRNRDYESGARIWFDTVQKRPANGRARINYATILMAEGRTADAEPHLRQAVAIDPRLVEAQLGLGVVLVAQRRFDEGMPHLRQALALEPDNVEAHRNLGEAFAAQGAMKDAVHHYDAALRLRPDDVMLLNRIGWILATSRTDELRDGPRARQLADRAVQLTQGQDPESLDTMAVAQAETGRFDAAVDSTRRALERARAVRPEMVPELEARLTLFQRREVFRQ